MFGLDTIIGEGLRIIDKFVPDTNARAAAKEQFEREARAAADRALSDQRDINKVEAVSPSMFVAGWRPAVGWLCVFTLAWQWVIAPAVTWAADAFFPGHFPPMPHLESKDSETLLYALLGIGGLRTVEKVTGSSTSGVSGILDAAKGLVKR